MSNVDRTEKAGNRPAATSPNRAPQAGAVRPEQACTHSPQPPVAGLVDASPGGTAADLPLTGADPALDQPFDADALFGLRSAVAAHASEMGAGPIVGDVVLLAHELSSNVVRHGGGTGRLQLWRAGKFLICRVSDSGTGLAAPEQAGTSRPSPSVPGGRGLWIARQLAGLEIDTGDDGTTITAELPIPDVAS